MTGRMAVCGHGNLWRKQLAVHFQVPTADGIWRDQQHRIHFCITLEPQKQAGAVWKKRVCDISWHTQGCGSCLKRRMPSSSESFRATGRELEIWVGVGKKKTVLCGRMISAKGRKMVWQSPSKLTFLPKPFFFNGLCNLTMFYSFCIAGWFCENKRDCNGERLI